MLKPKQDLSGTQVVRRSYSNPKTPDTSCWETWLLSMSLSTPSCIPCHRCLRSLKLLQAMQIHGTHRAGPGISSRPTPSRLLVHQDLN